MKKQYKYGLILLAICLLVVVGIWWQQKANESSPEATKEEPVAKKVKGDPVDAALDFYKPLMTALREAQSDPFVYERDHSKELDQAMQTKLAELASDSRVAVLNNLICQTRVPERLRTKRIFEADNEVQILIMAKAEDLLGQAVITLKPVDGRWKITDIVCGTGETAPEREFTFQEPGYLLKNVPPPLDSQYWHIVFKQEGVLGHTVPLFFNEQSNCIASNGTGSVCNPDQFTEASQAIVAGEMTESGLTVQRLEFLK